MDATSVFGKPSYGWVNTTICSTTICVSYLSDPMYLMMAILSGYLSGVPRQEAHFDCEENGIYRVSTDEDTISLFNYGTLIASEPFCDTTARCMAESVINNFVENAKEWILWNVGYIPDENDETEWYTIAEIQEIIDMYAEVAEELLDAMSEADDSAIRMTLEQALQVTPQDIIEYSRSFE